MDYKTGSVIVLTPIEQRYISTCYPLPDRPFYNEALFWKNKLRESSVKDEDIEVPFEDIGKAFPHICRLYKEGFFDERSIQSYFEGVDDKSHNMRMYLFAKRVARGKRPELALINVLRHVEACSVKPADLRRSLVWSYGAVRRSLIDTEYFNSSPQSDLVFVHGRSNGGEVVVRDVSEEEFERLKSWFEERQKSKENPFVRFRNELFSGTASDSI